MLPECACYCKDTCATNVRINLQIINNEMMILIYLICRYIMLHQFISSREFKICVVYLRMLSRMKEAYIFLFSVCTNRGRNNILNDFYSDWMTVPIPIQNGFVERFVLYKTIENSNRKINRKILFSNIQIFIVVRT